MFNPHDVHFSALMMFRDAAIYNQKFLPQLKDNTVNPFAGFVAIGSNRQFMAHREIKIQETLWPLEQLSGVNALVFDYGINGFA